MERAPAIRCISVPPAGSGCSDMLKYRIIAFGTMSESFYREAFDEYARRFGGRLTVTELKECRLPRDPAPREIAAALEEEADRMLAAVPKRAYTVALCVEGTEVPSEQLAVLMESRANGGDSEVCFLIGSSYGLSLRVKEAADLRLSLSKLTLPHQLARVVLAEAIYRTEEIRRGSAYHK